MKVSKDGYYKNNHSCYLLQYHLVLVTKYRHACINESVKESLLEYTNKFFNKYKCIVLEINTDKDHVHILFESPPQINLASFINAYKSGSSRNIRRTHQDFLRKFYWKPYFWSNSYFLATVSERSTKIVQKYIRSQGG